MKSLYGAAPEQRLLWQLVHSCLRLRQRQCLMDTFETLIRLHGAPDAAELTKVLRSCTNFNMFEPAVQMAKLSLSCGTCLPSKELQAIADAAVKKRRLPVADSVLELSKKYGLSVRISNHI